MAKKVLLFLFLVLFAGNIFSQKIDVADNYDFQLAINYAMNNGVDTLLLTTSGGIYNTVDTNYYLISQPLVIRAADGLAEMPIISHNAADSSEIEIFRVANDLTLEGVIIDGGAPYSYGMKYGVRAGDGPDGFPVHKTGLNITAKNCVFRNLYRDNVPDGQGHGIYFLKGVVGGTVKVENCTFENIGDEAIRMTETEKFDTERVLDSLIVRNCSFTNIDAECIRFYADTDTSTTDAYILIENLTVDRSATRMMYIKNNQNALVRNVIVSNSRLPGTDRSERADYIMQVQQRGSFVTNVDTFNIVYGFNRSATTIGATKGGLGVENIFSFDPMYADGANKDWTLNAASPAYYSGVNNVHLGDLRWATETPTVAPLNVEVTEGGTVTFSPERKGLTFPSGTSVTVTAVPDSGYEFTGWGGDLSGTANPETITVDAIKSITANFSPVTGIEDEPIEAIAYKLEQNYPNPFNPSTRINYSVEKPGMTRISVYDALGRTVKVLVNEFKNPGTYNIEFNGEGLSTGIYFYEIVSGQFTNIKKMILIK